MAGYYDIDSSREKNFYTAIRNYYPSLPNDSLTPDYSGIRPKLRGPFERPSPSRGEARIDVNDFLIVGSELHGIDGLINMFGIESPGLTSSLSIADYVALLGAY